MCRILVIPEALSTSVKIEKSVCAAYTHTTLRAPRGPPHTHMHHPNTARAHTDTRSLRRARSHRHTPRHAHRADQGRDLASVGTTPVEITTEGRGRLRIPRRLAPLPRTAPPLLCRNCNPLLLAALRPRLGPAVNIHRRRLLSGVVSRSDLREVILRHGLLRVGVRRGLGVGVGVGAWAWARGRGAWVWAWAWVWA